MHNVRIYYKNRAAEGRLGSPANGRNCQPDHTSMPPQKLDDLLKSCKNRELAQIVERADAIGALTAALQAALPAELANSLVAANVDAAGELVVVARSPAFAARLRFERDALIEAAGSAGEPAKSLKLRVAHDPG